MRPRDTLCLELDKDAKGEAAVLFLSKEVYIAKVDKTIKEWVCRLISGDIPSDCYKAIPQRGNTVHIIRLQESTSSEEYSFLWVVHKEDEVDKQRCPRCRGLGSEEREIREVPGRTHTVVSTCSKCRGSGWIHRT